MKKIISLLLCILMIFPATLPLCHASAIKETLDDGSYIVEDFEYEDVNLDGAETSESFITKIINLIKRIIELIFGKKAEETPEIKTTSATKYSEYYDKNGTLLWAVYLTGYFSYNGDTSTCTDSSVSYIIHDSDWKLLSVENTETTNTAKASFTVKQYKLGVPLKTIQRELTITCDKDGKLK